MRLLLTLLAVGGLFAADTFYLGTWKIVSAAPAPWSSKEQPPDPKGMKAVMGKTITFAPKSIQGPRLFVCNGAKYQVKDYPPDMIYQGAFEEMHRKNASVDAAKLAGGLGFKGKTVKTLETGCEFDFHYIDDTTGTFALDNSIYTMKKQ